MVRRDARAPGAYGARCGVCTVRNHRDGSPVSPLTSRPPARRRAAHKPARRRPQGVGHPAAGRAGTWTPGGLGASARRPRQAARPAETQYARTAPCSPVRDRGARDAGTNEGCSRVHVSSHRAAGRPCSGRSCAGRGVGATDVRGTAVEASARRRKHALNFFLA